MQKITNAGLLPVGMTDGLPPFASFEALCVEKIMFVFQGFAYQRVSAPLLEFDDTLVSDNTSDISKQTFRLLDPISGKMMGVRADMTSQIGRIATTRLKTEPRPLRLAYCGHVVRIHAQQNNPARQVLQVGAELIGVDNAKADAEIILLAQESLKNIGVDSFSFDLNLPTLFPALCRALDIDEEDKKILTTLLNQKDFSQVHTKMNTLGKKVRAHLGVFENLFQSYGECERVLDVLKSLRLTSEANAECARLIDVVNVLKNQCPDIDLTIDALENRGFEYHCGVAFSIFSKKKEIELGRGGRYIAGLNFAHSEPATGMTLFMGNVMETLTVPYPEKRLYIPVETSFAQAKQLRDAGYEVVCGLRTNEDPKQLKCRYIYQEGKVLPV